MKSTLMLIIAFSGFFSVCSGQQNSKWDKWSWLIGEWQGENSGQPGQGAGTFSFTPDLKNEIIVRKSHTEFPAAENKPAIVHDDLLIVYSDPSTRGDNAIYFDNEGHTIKYSVTYKDRSIILRSDKIPDNPVFRLVYTLLDERTVNTRFEMSGDGEKFTPYIEGNSRKIK